MPFETLTARAVGAPVFSCSITLPMLEGICDFS